MYITRKAFILYLLNLKEFEQKKKANIYTNCYECNNDTYL